MKKILSIYDFLKELGGLERVMFFQANKLKKSHEVNLVFGYVSEKEREKIIEELELNKEIKVLQMSRLRNEILQLIISFLFPSRIKKHDADLLICHSFMASRMAYYKKKEQGTPYVVILYHPPNFIYSNTKGWANNLPRFFARILGKVIGWKIKKIDYKAVNAADAVIAISEYSAKRVKEIYRLKPFIVYPQVSNFFKLIKENEKKDFLDKKKIKNKFLFAHGRIIPDKNYTILLDVMKSMPDEDLIISGGISEKYKEELERKITEGGLQERVKILGRISGEDLLGYYNCAEVFLMPAQKEDFGLTPVEAMACGCTDGTLGVVEKYTKKSKKFKHYILNLRRGKNVVIDNIIKKSQGDIIIINDADWIFTFKNKEALNNFFKIFDNPKIGGIAESFPAEWDEKKIKEGNFIYKAVAYGNYFWIKYLKEKFTCKENNNLFITKSSMFLTNIFRRKLYNPCYSLGDDFERTSDIINRSYKIAVFNDPLVPRMIVSYNYIGLKDLTKQKIRTAIARRQINNPLYINYLSMMSYIILSSWKKSFYCGIAVSFWAVILMAGELISKFKAADTKIGWQLRAERHSDQ